MFLMFYVWAFLIEMNLLLFTDSIGKIHLKKSTYTLLIVIFYIIWYRHLYWSLMGKLYCRKSRQYNSTTQLIKNATINALTKTDTDTKVDHSKKYFFISKARDEKYFHNCLKHPKAPKAKYREEAVISTLFCLFYFIIWLVSSYVVLMNATLIFRSTAVE